MTDPAKPAATAAAASAAPKSRWKLVVYGVLVVLTLAAIGYRWFMTTPAVTPPPVNQGVPAENSNK